MRGLQNIDEAGQLYTIDAMRIHYEICLEQWENVKRLKLQVESQILSKKGKPEREPKRRDVLRLLSYSWHLMDSVYRVGKLANFVRGFSHKSDEYKTLAIVTKSVKDFRNVYQHLDKELKSVEDGDNPIMGLFSWVCRNQTTSITLALGMLAAKGSVHGMIVDSYEGKYVTDIQFTAGRKDLYLSDVMRALSGFMNFFEGWLDEKDYLSEKEIKPSLMVMDIEGLTRA